METLHARVFFPAAGSPEKVARFSARRDYSQIGCWTAEIAATLDMLRNIQQHPVDGNGSEV